jgi:uncharacterized damage-inducible protein DinB
MKRTSIFLAAALAVTVSAQEKATIARSLDVSFGRAEQELVPAVEAMPDAKFDFVPSTGEFKGVRTFAQQAKHVAAVNFQVAATMLGEKPPADLGGENGPETLKAKADVVKFVKDSYVYAHRALNAMNDQNALEPIKSPWGSGTTTRFALATILLGHTFDHYGQMVVYLRMNGIVPPASR